MNETTKAKQYWGSAENEATKGFGIDIGCGLDPVTPNAKCFDVDDGDANCVTKYVNQQFDFVYSSHCLEHMHDPQFTILDWWKLVRKGGYLFVVVPDEDLYEQGVYPSRFNPDHKSTFTLSKSKSWSPVSFNVLDLARSLPGGELVKLQLQDHGYDRRLTSFKQNEPDYFIRLFCNFYARFLKFSGKEKSVDIRQLFSSFYPIDQTGTCFNAQAQIQLIVRKVNGE